jgi:hypothetical protein
MTDFCRSFGAGRKQEEFQISKTLLAWAYGMCQSSAVDDLVLASRVE